MSDKSAIQEYFELRLQRNAINERLDAIQDTVIAELRRQDGRAQLGDHNLRLSSYVAWEYSPTVHGMQTSLNERKREERNDGTAKIKERRDMLVLNLQRSPQTLSEDPTDYEWEPAEQD